MIPWFKQTVWHIGPIPIQVWGFFVALGMVVTLIILFKRSSLVTKDKERVLDLALWMIVSGVFFSRLFHIFFYEPGFYFAQPLEILKVWHGGLSSFGGVFGAVIAFFGYCRWRHIQRKDLLPIADLVSFAALFGWMVGRLGCVMIHDHMGRTCDCFIAIQSPDGPRLEMAMLEILGLIPLGILFFLKRKKQLPEGWYTAVLFIYYGALRFVLDFFRATDIAGADTRYLGLTPAQYFAIVLIAVGGYLLKKKQGKVA